MPKSSFEYFSQKPETSKHVPVSGKPRDRLIVPDLYDEHISAPSESKPPDQEDVPVFIDEVVIPASDKPKGEEALLPDNFLDEHPFSIMDRPLPQHGRLPTDLIAVSEDQELPKTRREIRETDKSVPVSGELRKTGVIPNYDEAIPASSETKKGEPEHKSLCEAIRSYQLMKGISEEGEQENVRLLVSEMIAEVVNTITNTIKNAISESDTIKAIEKMILADLQTAEVTIDDDVKGLISETIQQEVLRTQIDGLKTKGA